MPSNPLQRKVRNSFLLGLFSMLVLVLIIGAVVFVLVIRPKIEQQKKEESIMFIAYRLKNGIDLKSGEIVESSMIEEVKIPVSTAQITTDFVKPIFFIVDGNKPPIRSKLDLKSGTILTKNMFYQEEKDMDNSLRYTEYSMITMPTTVDIGTFVDIRLRLTNGQDLVVVSKKEIKNIYGQTVGLNLTEDEILILNSAIVEAYIMTGSELYMTEYLEAGRQDAATYTYSPTAETIELIKANPNITEIARNEIANKYLGSGIVRNPINAAIQQYSESAKENIEAGMTEQIENARKARESYLSGLEGY